MHRKRKEKTDMFEETLEQQTAEQQTAPEGEGALRNPLKAPPMKKARRAGRARPSRPAKMAARAAQNPNRNSLR